MIHSPAPYISQLSWPVQCEVACRSSADPEQALHETSPKSDYGYLEQMAQILFIVSAALVQGGEGLGYCRLSQNDSDLLLNQYRQLVRN